MTGKKIIDLFKRKQGLILLVGVLVAVASFWFAILFNEKYKAKSDILVVQNQEGFTDYYALSRSAGYLADVLIESIYSERFLEEMKETEIISLNVFLPSDKVGRLKEWNKTINISKTADTGILKIEILSNNEKQAEKISDAVLEAVTVKSYLFLGEGQNLDIRILSGPVVEDNLSLGKVLFISIIGFFFGVFIVFMVIYYIEEYREYKRQEGELI